MKNILIFIVILAATTANCQSVRLFEINDTTWYSMDKPAAQNVIIKANKGVYFDRYVESSTKLLASVLTAKSKADSIQILQQQSIGRLKAELIRSEQRLWQTRKSQFELSIENKKLKNQRWILGGSTLGMIILLVATL